MKKMVGWILLAAMLLVSVVSFAQEASGSGVYAESFELRKGLNFGATSADVEAAETLTQLTGTQMTIYGELQYKGTIAGIDDAIVGYFLDDNGRVDEMWYRFSPTSAAHGCEIYDYLLELLEEKYGEPMEDLGGEYRAVAGTVTQGAGPWVECSEWLLEMDDCYVKIDLMRSERKIANIEIRFVMLDYTCFTEEEASAILDKQAADKAEILSDL